MSWKRYSISSSSVRTVAECQPKSIVGFQFSTDDFDDCISDSLGVPFGFRKILVVGAVLDVRNAFDELGAKGGHFLKDRGFRYGLFKGSHAHRLPARSRVSSIFGKKSQGYLTRPRTPGNLIAMRPKKPHADRRTESISVPLTSAEKRGIVTVAERAGESLAAWSRRVLLKAAGRKR